MGRTEQSLQGAIRAAEALRNLGRGFAEALSDVGGTVRDLERIGGDKRILRQFAAVGMRQMDVRPPDSTSLLYTFEATIPTPVNYDRKYDGQSVAGWVRQDRRQDHVKVDSLIGQRVVPLSVVTFGHDMEMAPIEDALRKGGHRLAIPEEFRDFMETVKAIPLTLPIAACGSSCEDPDGRRYVLCLFGGERGRSVRVIVRDGLWSGRWRFLAAPL